MKIENMLQRFSCISFLFKPPWSKIIKSFPDISYIIETVSFKHVNRFVFLVSYKSALQIQMTALQVTVNTNYFNDWKFVLWYHHAFSRR